MVRLRAATRGSALARWQTDHIAALLRALDPDIEIDVVVIDTSGDRRLDVPIYELGGKGVFVKEVQAAVLNGRADFAVHSAKDLPARTPAGLVIAAVPERGDVRDALVGSTLADLPVGARVGTGSLRRQAQLGHLRPDLRFGNLRGNMQTRLDKAADHDAIVVAATALDRLGLAEHIAERLSIDVMLPQVAQAALAVECLVSDEAIRELLARIEDPLARRRVDAERAFLSELGGDCSLPAAAHATLNGTVTVEGIVASADGATLLRHRATGADGDAVGRAVARHLLDDLGGAELLGS